MPLPTPKFRLTSDWRRRVRAVFRQDGAATHRQIAAALGVHYDTARRYARKYPEFRQLVTELRAGRSRRR